MAIKHVASIGGAVLWLALIACGMAWLWVYSAQPGQGAAAPITWPMDVGITVQPGQATMIVFLHPRCPCSRATLEQMQRVLVKSGDATACHVVFVVPEGVDDGWEEGELLTSASLIPGITIHRDMQGVIAHRFAAATSGQVLVYDAQQQLAFDGGMTVSRGHAGDNDGAASVIAVLNGRSPRVSRAPVFGCPLFNRQACSQETDSCQL